MPEPDWKFRVMPRGEINSDPIESEFFTTGHLDSVADALVRESIQNSLDAGIPGKPIRVAFRLFTEKSATNRSMAQYLKGLHPHLTAEQNGLINAPSLNDPEHFLLIEDYGTRGLDGDPSQDDDLGGNSEKKNDFFYFWRNIGRSKKDQTDRGRWGLGKTVFQATSQINSFFGMTVRQSDSRTLLMGQSVLKTHLVRKQKHCPYGWFGQFDGDFVMPIDDTSYIEKFSTHFGLDRLGKSGLSVVIPYPDPTIKIENLLSSILLHYFFPILAKTLVVELNQDGKQQIINDQTIDKLITSADFSQSRLTNQDFKRLFDFTRWAHSVPVEGMVSLKSSASQGALKWSDELLEPEDLLKLRERFERKERLSIRVPMKVKPKDQPSQDTFFDIFVERDEKLDRAEDHFIREGITIAGVSTLRQKGIRIVVSIKDRALSAMLGDSENPAHTEWQERTPKFKDKYTYGVSSLRFVKNSPKEIVRILNKPVIGIDKTLLEEIFSIQTPSDKECGGISGGDGGTTGVGGKPPPVGQTNTEFWLVRSPGGFKVTANPKAKLIPQGVLITMAYEVRGRNPFKKFKTFDFEVDKSPIKVVMTGASKVPRNTKNQLLVQVTDPKFSVEVTGFDPHRDLRVQADPIWQQES